MTNEISRHGIAPAFFGIGFLCGQLLAAADCTENGVEDSVDIASGTSGGWLSVRAANPRDLRFHAPTLRGVRRP